MTEERERFLILMQSHLWDGIAWSPDDAIKVLIHQFPPLVKMEISIVLADATFVKELNRQYRGQNKPTNVLSFPMAAPTVLGDVVLSYETIAEEAIEQGKPFNDHATHLLLHGILHLLEYDHETEQEAAIMEKLEIQLLKTLDIPNPYEEHTPCLS